MTPLDAPADECAAVIKKKKNQGKIKEGTMRVQCNVGNVPAIAMESLLKDYVLVYLLPETDTLVPGKQLGVGLEAIFSQKCGRSIRLIRSNK